MTTTFDQPKSNIIALGRPIPSGEIKGPSAREFIRLSNQLHQFCADGIAAASPEWVAAQLADMASMIRAGQFPIK